VKRPLFHAFEEKPYQLREHVLGIIAIIVSKRPQHDPIPAQPIETTEIDHLAREPKEQGKEYKKDHHEQMEPKTTGDKGIFQVFI
jgi:hypothetical protein